MIYIYSVHHPESGNSKPARKAPFPRFLRFPFPQRSKPGKCCGLKRMTKNQTFPVSAPHRQIFDLKNLVMLEKTAYRSFRNREKRQILRGKPEGTNQYLAKKCGKQAFFAPREKGEKSSNARIGNNSNSPVQDQPDAH